MLYRVGNVAKGEIGAIKVYNSETHVEIAPGSVDRFLQAIGPDGTVEKDITVTRMEGVPKALDEKRDQPYAKKKRFGDHISGARGKPGQNRKFDPADRKSEPRERKFEPNDRKFEPKAGETPAEENPRARPTTTLKSRSKPFGKPPGKSWSKPGGRVEKRAEGRSEGKSENKPWSKPGGKSKKPYVSKFAKNGAKPGAKVGSKSGPKGRAPDASGFSPRKRTGPGNTD
jgi:ATP-dependent RNA helicase DeaD